jgi:hypothetical protein
MVGQLDCADAELLLAAINARPISAQLMPGFVGISRFLPSL